MIIESTINRVEDVSRDDIKVSESGLNVLKSKIDEINKKAIKWGLPPVKLEILKEEDVKVSVDSLSIDEFRKEFTVKIEGKSPQIEGYEFIAKIEHTDNGNLINVAPNSSIKELPAEYRDANSKCDVCKSDRERFNTFIIRNDKTNELMTVGSSCLKRFLPIDNVNKIIRYAEMLELLRSAAMDDDADGDSGVSDPNRYRNHYNVSDLIHFLCLAYLVNGKYISKKKASEVYNTTGQYVESTVELASNILTYRKAAGEPEPAYITKSKELKPQAVKMGEEVVVWMKAHDFKADAVAKPEMANYFNNLDVLSKASTANLKNFSYLSGILASYLIEQNMIKKKQQDAAKKPSEYVGQVGDKITNLPVTVVFIRGFESSYGFVTLYSFEDDNGNRLTWFSSSEIGLEEKKKYRIEKATVKAHQVSKYGGHKETILLRVKMTDLEGNKINEYTSRISDLV